MSPSAVVLMSIEPIGRGTYVIVDVRVYDREQERLAVQLARSVARAHYAMTGVRVGVLVGRGGDVGESPARLEHPRGRVVRQSQ